VSSKIPPTQIVEKAAHANSDLGPGAIVFDADGNSSHFHQKIMDKFPALETSGRYELLLYQRGGLEKGFDKLEPPSTHGRVTEVASQAQVYMHKEPNWVVIINKVSVIFGVGVIFFFNR